MTSELKGDDGDYKLLMMMTSSMDDFAGFKFCFVVTFSISSLSSTNQKLCFLANLNALSNNQDMGEKAL